MEKEKIVNEIKDIIIKIVNVEMAMENGRWLHVHRKILGIHQKLEWILKNIDEKTQNENISPEEFLEEIAMSDSNLNFEEDSVKKAKESGSMLKYGNDEKSYLVSRK